MVKFTEANFILIAFSIYSNKVYYIGKNNESQNS